MNEKQTLAFLRELWADLYDPNFVWQLVAFAVCMVLAWGVARAWQRRPQRGEGGARAKGWHDAGSRLAFPLSALLFVAAARLILKPWIHVNLLRLAFPLLASLALVRATVYLLRRAFPSALWLKVWERIIAFVIWVGLALYITDLAPEVVDALEQVSFHVGRQSIDLWMLLHGAVTVFLTVLVALWLAGLLESRLMGMQELDSSLRMVLVRLAKSLLTVLAVLLSLTLVGIDMTALSVFTGALGVGLGFGLQKIASNYVSGFIILLDRSIRLGNVIQLDTQTEGVVTQITTRYTVLRTLGGVEYLVPNEVLVGNVVQNQSYSDPRVRVATSVGVGYETDLDEASRLMVVAAAAHPRVLAEPAPAVLLTQFGDSAINLELGFWIADPHEGVGGVRSDVNRAIWKAFQTHGITIPYPHREVRVLGTSLT